MASSALTVTLLSEAIGVATGFPFGEYAYTPDRLGPKLFGLVPLIIPIAWFMVLYPAYETVRHLLDHFERTAIRLPRWLSELAQCTLSAIAMTAWDLSLDPRMVAGGYWSWRDGGAYFGIPLSNFAGWLLTSFVIYAIWHMIERTPARSMPLRSEGSRQGMASLHRALPMLAYSITWIGESIANLLFWSGPVVGLAVFVGMGMFAGPALFLWMRERFMPRRAPSPATSLTHPISRKNLHETLRSHSNRPET